MANANQLLDRVLVTLHSCSSSAMDNNTYMEFTLLYRSVNAVLRSVTPHIEDLNLVIKYSNYFGSQGTDLVEAVGEYMESLV